MSAETLRRAASLMRERATHPDVSGSPWTASPHGDVHDDGSLWVCDSQSGETAEHIASWHPAVALAVAVWLDVVAARYEALLDTFAPGSRAGAVTAAENVTGWHEVLTVARAYLGEASDA